MSDHHKHSVSQHSAYTATSETVLKIPRAQDWAKGTPIHLKNDSSRVLFRVLETLNRGTAIEPHFRTILTDAQENQVLCLVKYNRKSLQPHWCIYLAATATSCPRRDSGKLTSGDRDSLPPNMQLVGLLYKTGEFKTTKCEADNETSTNEPMPYRYQSVRGGKLCGCVGSSRRIIDVTDANDSSTSAFVRNQLTETMTVATGENLIVAAALAYALDRRYKPLGSTEERLERTRQARKQAEILGLQGPPARRTSNAVQTVPLKDKHEGLQILEPSEANGADAVMITLAEGTGGSREHKKGVDVIPANATTKTTAAKGPRKRRKRQLSVPNLEMMGDVITERVS